MIQEMIKVEHQMSASQTNMRASKHTDSKVEVRHMARWAPPKFRNNGHTLMTRSQIAIAEIASYYQRLFF